MPPRDADDTRRSPIAVCTVLAANYAGHARVLAHSLRAQHPELRLTALVVDGLEDSGRKGEPFGVIDQDAIALPDRRRLLFGHSVLGSACVLKAHLLGHLLETSCDRALYLDPDILVLGSLDPLFDALGRHSVVLTPHLTSEPTGGDPVARELSVLRAGVFNAGVVGVAGSPGARSFLAWWQARVREHCRHAPAEGILHDQRWLDLAPSMFDGVHALRDPGLHVGPWNVLDHPVVVEPTGVRVGGRPARLWHFSGFDHRRPSVVTRHVPDQSVTDLGPAAALFERYRSALEAAGATEALDTPYGYGSFDDGAAIPEVARDLFREQGAAAVRFGDPFASGGAESYRAWLAASVDDDAPAIARIWDAVRRRRADLVRAFPDHLGAQREAFADWIARAGGREHPDVAALTGHGTAVRSAG